MACCFWPEQVEQGVSALTLRRTRSRHIHAGAASARTAARFFIGLERKGGRCCTAPLRRARRLTSWPCPAFMESVKQAQAGSGPAHGVPVSKGHPAAFRSAEIGRVYHSEIKVTIRESGHCFHAVCIVATVQLKRLCFHSFSPPGYSARYRSRCFVW